MTGLILFFKMQAFGWSTTQNHLQILHQNSWLRKRNILQCHCNSKIEKIAIFFTIQSPTMVCSRVTAIRIFWRKYGWFLIIHLPTFHFACCYFNEISLSLPQWRMQSSGCGQSSLASNSTTSVQVRDSEIWLSWQLLISCLGPLLSRLFWSVTQCILE